MDTCYVCGETIQSEKELTIEHKTPWLHSDIPIELFYDIDNIAFSHAKCNKSNRKNTVLKQSSSKYKGIYKDKNAWIAITTHKRKRVHIGSFKTQEEAAIAYDKKVLEISGNEAITNKSLGLLN
jgi:hypothetical protein